MYRIGTVSQVVLIQLIMFVRYRLTFELMENCKMSHTEKDSSTLTTRPMPAMATLSPAAKIRYR
jgi:hypothetical protein